MQRIIRECHRVLNEGRFFVVNISPVLIPRESRNKSSKRLYLPADFHKIFIEENYDFIDDIIWQKPEGAANKRGQGFRNNRIPLAYKPKIVTEYILVYRKHTDRLIDWNINKYPNRVIVEESKVQGDYEETNIWRISPSRSKKHPAIFPKELAERIIKYYSFLNDVVLDPFAGIGTTGVVAKELDRRYVLIEQKEEYIREIECSSN